MRVLRQFSVLVILLSFLSCDGLFRDKNKIIVQEFTGLEPGLADTLRNCIQDFYPLEIIESEEIEIPENAFVNIKSPRYRADTLLKFLKRIRHDDVYYIIGLTSADISTTKRDAIGRVKKPESRYQDWGVFGLGYRPGPSCIVSTFRIKHSNHKVFISRFKKICIHEIGHNMGLKHCPNEECVMRDAAESIKTIDYVKLDLCDDCKNEVGL